MYYGGTDTNVYFNDFYSGHFPSTYGRGRPIDCAKVCYDCETCNQSTLTQKMCVKDCTACTACMNMSAPSASPHLHLSRNYSPANECAATCGMRTCYDFHKQWQRYRHCLQHHSTEHCKKRFGCKIYRGMRFRYAAPINPKNTNCVKCWESGFTIL